jgi:acyl-CoA synthetase (AMP-forming)/AMP-acid ligase II
MNLIDAIHQHALARPEAPAIVTPKGRLSWRHFDQRVWSMAQRLHGAGIRAHDRIGLTTISPLNHLIASTALARIGAAHIALPPSDGPELRADIQRRLCLSRVLCDHEDLGGGPNALVLPRTEALDLSVAEHERIRCDDPEAPWLILQSSGTTGRPKFAMLTQREAIERYRRYRPLFNCGPQDVFWPASRLDFVVAKQRSLFSMLAGATLCLSTGLAMSPELVAFLEETGVTLACGTPSHLHALIDMGVPMPTLRVFEARSAVISERLRRDFRARISDALHIVYATNEGETLTLATPLQLSQQPDTVGRPVAPIELQIVDSTGTPLPVGQTGEIRVRGPGIVTSYLDHPEATARSFREGWFHPGDLGYLSESGDLFLQGRMDDMMIFDGMNIYPAEIEQALSAHPAVREVAAFALRHQKFQDIPAAAVTLREPVGEADLIVFAQARMGLRHPRRVFVLEAFPRNAMGKILKRTLREQVLSPHTSAGGQGSGERELNVWGRAHRAGHPRTD